MIMTSRSLLILLVVVSIGSIDAIPIVRVNFTAYYESLSADCRQFTATQVCNAFRPVLDIVNFTFVPFRNAGDASQSEAQLCQFYYQHGADECYGNLIHVSQRILLSLSDLYDKTCVMALYPNVRQHMVEEKWIMCRLFCILAVHLSSVWIRFSVISRRSPDNVQGRPVLTRVKSSTTLRVERVISGNTPMLFELDS